MVPERKLTPEDVKYVLSSHYQGTPFDPYASYGDKSMKGAYRSIGINRNDFMASSRCGLTCRKTSARWSGSPTLQCFQHHGAVLRQRRAHPGLSGLHHR